MILIASLLIVIAEPTSAFHQVQSTTARSRFSIRNVRDQEANCMLLYAEIPTGLDSIVDYCPSAVALGIWRSIDQHDTSLTCNGLARIRPAFLVETVSTTLMHAERLEWFSRNSIDLSAVSGHCGLRSPMGQAHISTGAGPCARPILTGSGFSIENTILHQKPRAVQMMDDSKLLPLVVALPRSSRTFSRHALGLIPSSFTIHKSTSTTSTPPLPQPPRPISTLGKLNSLDGRRQPRLKEISFVFKHGQRHHAYDSEKAPYPQSYDREVLELESLDNRFISYLRGGSVSFLNFEAPPERVLDLGCGMGTWIIDAAKEWPECEFVGFDLVNIQIPTNVLDESLQERISWVHGNFLTTKLPFEDDEFDHVHIQSIARAVPENKWDNLFEEINRILRPGGSVEITEDDIVFPFLPRWFTAPLRARPRRSTSIHFPDGSQRGYPSPQDTLDEDTPSHDHALLESLYKSVFAHRFINMKPSALLPNYFTTYFRHCTIGPVISWPMPPIPPLQPLPDQIVTSYAVDSGAENSDLRMSTVFPLSADGSPSTSSGPMNTRPNSLSFSSTISSRSTMDSSTNESSLSTLFSTMGREKSGSISSTSSEKPNIEVLTEEESVKSAGTDSDATLPIRTATPPPKFVPFLLESSSADSTTVSSIPSALFPAVRLASMNERSLAMHLYRSYTIVLACREALWEELKDRIRNRRDELQPFGWEDDDDFEETQHRKKFEKLTERYQNDMQARASLWCSLNNIGWPFPPREPLKKAELVEEQRMREAMLEARKHAPAEDLHVPCRTARTLVGYKPLVT